jgi:hypothetical protein
VKLDRIRRNLSDALPFVTKKRAARDKQSALNQAYSTHAAELEQEHQRVDALIEKLTRLSWSRSGDVYRCGIMFDSRIMYGYNTLADLDFLGQMIARQVRHEIASSRFIEKAYDSPH